MGKLAISSAIIVATVILAGCGGGGGGSSSPSVTPTTPTSPSAPPTVAASLQAAVTPTYSSTSEEYGYYQAVNAFRTSQGLGPLNQNISYDKASAAHANYCFLNSFGHNEVQGLPGFTGENPLDRVVYQGGTASLATEEGGLPDVQGAPGSGANFAGVIINTVYHRASLMYQGLTDIGVSIGMSAPSAPTAIPSFSDMGYVKQQVNAGNYFGFYPANGQTGVSLHFHGEEPSPVPAGTDVTQVGSPISVAAQESTSLTVSSFTVTQNGAASALPATIITSTDPNLTGSNNLAFLLSGQAFLPSTTYTAHFVGTVTGPATGSTTGIPVDMSWSFTTGTSSY